MFVYFTASVLYYNEKVKKQTNKSNLQDVVRVLGRFCK